jgi:hypothetical protein
MLLLYGEFVKDVDDTESPTGAGCNVASRMQGLFFVKL